MVGNKKRAELFLACNACNNESPVVSTKKNIERGIDIIIKYLQAGNEWKIPKGSIVRKIELPNTIVTDTSVEEYVPFDDI